MKAAMEFFFCLLHSLYVCTVEMQEVWRTSKHAVLMRPHYLYIRCVKHIYGCTRTDCKWCRVKVICPYLAVTLMREAAGEGSSLLGLEVQQNWWWLKLWALGWLLPNEAWERWVMVERLENECSLTKTGRVTGDRRRKWGTEMDREIKLKSRQQKQTDDKST